MTIMKYGTGTGISKYVINTFAIGFPCYYLIHLFIKIKNKNKDKHNQFDEFHTSCKTNHFKLNNEHIEKLIASRRSIFPPSYDPTRIVPKDIIMKMIEAGNWAPNHGKTEPWRFIVFSGKKALNELGCFEAELYKKTCEKFQKFKYDKKIKNNILSSHVIAICMERQKSNKIPEIEEIEAVACAVQNMHLVATAYNVVGYWSSGDIIYSKEMKDFLQLKNDSDKCLGLFHVGYTNKPIPKGIRKSTGLDKTKWIE